MAEADERCRDRRGRGDQLVDRDHLALAVATVLGRRRRGGWRTRRARPCGRAAAPRARRRRARRRRRRRVGGGTPTRRSATATAPPTRTAASGPATPRRRTPRRRTPSARAHALDEPAGRVLVGGVLPDLLEAHDVGLQPLEPGDDLRPAVLPPRLEQRPGVELHDAQRGIGRSGDLEGERSDRLGGHGTLGPVTTVDSTASWTSCVTSLPGWGGSSWRSAAGPTRRSSAAMAHRTLGPDRVHAVTAVSPSLATTEHDDCRHAGGRVGAALDARRDRRDGPGRVPRQRHRPLLPLQGRADGRARADRRGGGRPDRPRRERRRPR